MEVDDIFVEISKEIRLITKAVQCEVEVTELIHEFALLRLCPQNSSSSVTVFIQSKDG